MDTKVGVYLCSGCGISDVIDLEDLKGVATETGAAVVETHERLCEGEGLQMIKDGIAADELNRTVVCACSARVMTDNFDFGPEMVTIRTNLREQVAWCHEADDEDTQMLAQDYVRMGVAQAQNSEPLTPEVHGTNAAVMVVGGGFTGLTAAKAASDAGSKVHLIEKEDVLGGWSAKFSKSFPRRAPWTDLEDNGIDQLVDAVEADGNITVHTGACIAKTTGGPGAFEVTLHGSDEKLAIGSIVQATGWKPYDPSKLGFWGYGTSANVVTNVQMESMLKEGMVETDGGRAPKSVAFIQCAGSRDADHLPYCSGVCCRASLKQAAMIREMYPDTKVYILYRDLRSPGQFELFYQKAQDDPGIFLTKGDVTEVKPDGGEIAVSLTDSLLGENIRISAEMVVLAAGMVPTMKVDDGILDKDEGAEEETCEGAEAGAEAEVKEVDADALPEGAWKADTGAIYEGDGFLNLEYRQGPGLPELKYGFPDSHFVCFPYETRRTGIYAAGCVRAPMDTVQARKDAFGASLKAIQACALTSRGEAVHPRARDTSIPDFFLQRCTQCKRCTEECPFGTLNEDTKGTPEHNPTRCRRCGICMGACPERIISFKNYSPNMVSQMIKSIEIPDEEDEKPRYLVFMCENDAYPAIDLAGVKRMKYSSMVRIIPVRCIGAVNTVWIGDALSAGFDGIMLFGCKYGDDYQCHFVKGSELANTRMDNVRDKLQQLALEEERVQIHAVAINDFHKIPQMIDDFVEEIDDVGMNPFKGF